MEDRKRLIFYFTPTVKAASGVEEYHSLSVGVGGDTGHCGAAQIEHVERCAMPSHYILDEKEMTGQHQHENLSCKGTSCTMPGTLMALLPDGQKLQREQGGRAHLPVLGE